MRGPTEKFRKTIYEKQAAGVVENLRKRNMDAAYFPECGPAVEHICGLIPKGSLVGFGGSATVVDSGLVDAIRKLDVRLLDRYRENVPAEEMAEMRIRGMSADVLIASCNAITKDGKLISEDGLGNRVAGMIFGPKKVILMVGMNKLVQDVGEGMARIKSVCAPMNSVRFGADTPCARTGFCDDANCLPPSRICGQIAIIEGNLVDSRITVVLVGEILGF